MVTVHLQSSFVYLHIFTSTNVGVFGLKYAKLSTFCILQFFFFFLLNVFCKFLQPLMWLLLEFATLKAYDIECNEN